MKLIMIRHGETEANVKKLNQGANHGKLTRKGLTQAKRTARYLSSKRIDFIYSSDLKRAKDTVSEIQKKVDAPVKFVKELRERNLGEFEGMPYGSFRKFVKKHGFDLMTYTPKDGESIKESDARVTAFYKDCLEKHKENTVLWVSHGSVLKRMLIHALQKDAKKYKKLHPSNCSISIIQLSNTGQLDVPVVNYVKHLVPRKGLKKTKVDA